MELYFTDVNCHVRRETRPWNAHSDTLTLSSSSPWDSPGFLLSMFHTAAQTRHRNTHCVFPIVDQAQDYSGLFSQQLLNAGVLLQPYIHSRGVAHRVGKLKPCSETLECDAQWGAQLGAQKVCGLFSHLVLDLFSQGWIFL